MDKSMTSGKPLTLIIKFVIPIFFGFIFQQLYNMVDTIIVGHFVSPGALAAVGSTGTIMFMFIGLASGLTTGYTVLISQKYGASDLEGTRRAFVNAILLSVISVLVLTVISVSLMHPLLHVMQTPADIYDDAYAYIITICGGSVTIVFYNLLAASLRAIGNSRTPLYFLIIAVVLNIILDLVFIIGFGLGTMGAALATDISQGTSAVLSFIYIYKKVDVLRPKRSDWRLDPVYSAKQLNVGVPMSLQFGITASGTMVMQAAINSFGSVAVTGFTAASKVTNLMTAGMPSIGQAMAAYVGQNYGYGNLDRIRQGTRDALKISVIYSVVNGILSVLLLPYIIVLFFDSGVDISVYMPYARTYCIWCSLFYIPLAMIFIYRNTMQGCGWGKTALMLGISELFARLACAITAMELHNFTFAAGADAIAWIVAGVLSYFLYRFVISSEEKRKIRAQSEIRHDDV